MDNREAWKLPKKRDLALDRPRVERQLAIRDRRLKAEAKAREDERARLDRVAREEAAKQAEFAKRAPVELERDRARRLTRELQALDPERRADFAERAKDELLEEGLRVTSPAWAAKLTERTLLLLERSQEAVACR